MPTVLTGSSQPVPLGEGYAIRAPGIRGSADLKRPRSATERSRSRTADDGTAALDEALTAANVTEVRQVELSVRPVAATEAAAPLRSVAGGDAVELQVPDLGSEVGQLVLACDEAGVMTWHLPVGAPGTGGEAAAAGATRGAGGVKRFIIPATPVEAPPTEAGASRSLFSAVGRKLLKVLVYPVTDPIIGTISTLYAEHWEGKNRPYGLRNFVPENFTLRDGAALGAAEWTTLGAGPALLFVHGTFSTAHGAFGGLDPQAFAELHRRYNGRVFAFNHFTLAHDPAENVKWMLSNIPPAQRLTLDIVTHSRGGLVARTLAERPDAFGLPASNISVNRVIFVGVPNYGTPLANPDHMMAMIDRLTTALNLFPTGPVVETLEAMITAIKMIAHGGIGGLRGLASMRPDGDFLKKLNDGRQQTSKYFAIGADYEPQGTGLRALVRGTVADAALDYIFADKANDLVVPEAGVYGADGSGAFPLKDASVLRLPGTAGVIHTRMFTHAPASAKLLEWLA